MNQTPQSDRNESINSTRADAIEHAILSEFDAGSAEEGLIDVLASARHFADANGLDFAACDRVAYQHYLEER